MPAPLSIAVMKAQWRILASAHPMSPEGFEHVQGLRRRVCDGHGHREGIRGFEDERAPRLRGG